MLLVVVPVLRRPHRVKPLLASLRRSTADYRVLFVCDPDDEPEKSAVDAAGAERIDVEGNYARKINAAFAASSEPYIFTGADDLEFHQRWFENAYHAMQPGIGVVGTNDLGNSRVMRGEHSTHSLVSRRYIDRFGTIDEPGKVLHEGYPHEFVDDEFIETAKFRGVFRFAANSIVEHLHPNWGKAPIDDLYAAQKFRMKQGRRLYLRRRHLWTSPSSSPPSVA